MSDEKDEAIPGGSRLQLKPKEYKNPGLIQEPEPDKKKKKRKRGSAKEKKPASASKAFGLRFLGQSIGSFVIGGLLLGAFLYHQATGMDMLSPQQANMARGIAVTSFLAILIIEAFTEDMMQGILCFFLLPYSFVYGLLFADAGPIRGLTVAVLLFFGAEMYFTPDDALVPTVAETVNGWIRAGQDRLIYPDGRPEAGFDRPGEMGD